MSNAKEINASEFYRRLAYSFEDTCTWIDVATQVLQYVGWSPECSSPTHLNILKTLPPSFSHDFLIIGGGNDGGLSDRIERWNKSPERERLNVHVGVALLNQIGITVCVITDDRKTLYTSLYINGRNILVDSPEYLEVAAILHGLRALHGWIMKTKKNNRPNRTINLRAGDFKTISAIEKWMSQGTLTITSQLASPLIEDLDRLEEWLEDPLWIRPFETPTIMGLAETLPWRCTEVLEATEKFRTKGLEELGRDWASSLPVIPLGGEEVKNLLKQQEKDDEFLAIRQLGEIESVSAAIITRLGLTRETIKAALSRLRMNHKAQTNLLGILCGTRFKYYHKGDLFPTACPNKHKGSVCGATDSFAHLLRCYALNKHLKEGPAEAGFLVLMAKRTFPKGVNYPRPRHIAEETPREARGE